MKRPLRVIATVTICALVAACGQESSEPVPRVAADPVVVFAAGADRAYLAGFFAAYTRATGNPVIVRTGTTVQLVTDVIDNIIEPAADLLWVDDVSALHQAAEEGALRPIRSEFLAAAVPRPLRDPDGFWTAISYRLGLIVIAPDAGERTRPSGYGTLAAERFSSRICLGSVTNPVNRAVIGVLLEQLGARRAETAVRLWIRGLAREIYADDARLLAAITAGDCPVGIVPSDVLLEAQRAGRAEGVSTVLPVPAAVHAEGIGIGRHARNPDGALALLEWMLVDSVVAEHAAGRGAYPAAADARLPAGLDAHDTAQLPALSGLAFNSRDAELLAERAGYRD